VVNVVGDYGFGFCGEELAVAVQYNIPFICIIINNGYLSLIRQSQKYGFNMNYEVETWYDGHMMDFVKFAEAYGAYGERVEKPQDIKPALQRAVNLNQPAIIEVIVERETDASMGASIDKIVEFEPLPSAVTPVMASR
jgi:tartronate-semialdehyde synthase